MLWVHSQSHVDPYSLLLIGSSEIISYITASETRNNWTFPVKWKLFCFPSVRGFHSHDTSPFGAGGYWMSDRATLVSALLLSSNLCNITMICISISLAEHLPPHSTPIYAQQRRETISDVCQILCRHVLRTFIQPPPNHPVTSEGPLLTVFVLKTSTFNFNPQKQDTNTNPQ